MYATVNNYETIHTDMRCCTHKIWTAVLLLLESRVIINDLDVILNNYCL